MALRAFVAGQFATLARVKALEAENAKLKRLLAESILDAEALKVALRAKIVIPLAKRAAIAAMRKGRTISLRRASGGWSCRGPYWHTQRGRISRLEFSIGSLTDPATTRRRFGHRRLHALLRREGVTVNHKRCVGDLPGTSQAA